MTTKKKAAPKKKATKKPEPPKERLQGFDLLGAQMSCKPRLRNSALPKYSVLARKMAEITAITEMGVSGFQNHLEVRFASAIMEGLDEDITRLLIEFAVEVITHLVVEGVDADYLAMTPDERGDFIDLHLTPAQLITLFYTVWRVYSGG